MQNDVNRRIYMGALLAATAALMLFRLVAIPLWSDSETNTWDVAAEVADSFLGGTLAALGFSGLFLLLYRRTEDQTDEAISVPSRDISKEVRTAITDTSEWGYRGHTGRYFRSSVLPSLSQKSKQHGRYIHVRMQLLDPDDNDAMSYFVKYRRSVNPDRASYWTRQQAMSEILATVVSLATAPLSNPRITPAIYLGGSVSPFTVDMASSVAIITRESATLGALKYPAGSSFFDSMAEDLHLGRDQARRLPNLPTDLLPVDSIDSLRITLGHLGVGKHADNEVLEVALRAVLNPVNPYPNG